MKADKRLIESSFQPEDSPGIGRHRLPQTGPAAGDHQGGGPGETLEDDLRGVPELRRRSGVDSGHVRNRRNRQEAAGDSCRPAPTGERQDGEGTEDGADGHAFFAEAPQDGASDGESLTPRDEALVGRVAAGKSDYWDAELFEYIASTF